MSTTQYLNGPLIKDGLFAPDLYREKKFILGPSQRVRLCTHWRAHQKIADDRLAVIRQNLRGRQYDNIGDDALGDATRGTRLVTLNNEVPQTWKSMKRMTPQEWDERAAAQYRGYNRPSPKQRTLNQVQSAVRKALMETLATQVVGQDFRVASSAAQNSGHESGDENMSQEDQFVSSQSSSSASQTQEQNRLDSDVMLTDDQIEGSVKSLAGTPHSKTQAKNCESLHNIDGQAWGDTSLKESGLKFAVVKRTSQLLGMRVPDPAIATISKASDLVQSLVDKPKPTKLQDLFRANATYAGSKNIKWERRSRVYDDRQFGSLKVIEDELQRMRVLTPKQREWALGK